MSLNPEKISGLCGRLMCCLSFEHEGYAGSKKCPKVAKIIGTADAFNAISPKDDKTIELEKMDNDSDFQ
jgi:cell fate regulator YaaT (PSP1 superfamily)